MFQTYFYNNFPQVETLWQADWSLPSSTRQSPVNRAGVFFFDRVICTWVHDLKVFQMIMRYVINDEWYENKTRGNLWDLNQKQSQRECGVRDQDVKLHFWSLDIEKCLVFLSYIITIVKDISCKPGEFCFEQRIVVGAKRLKRKAQSLYLHNIVYTYWVTSSHSNGILSCSL